MSSLKSRKRTERITNALCFIALIFLTCLCMLPIWWIFRSSLMSNAELFKWPPAFLPPRWLFSNYANTLEYFKFWTYLKNTMIIIVPVCHLRHHHGHDVRLCLRAPALPPAELPVHAVRRLHAAADHGHAHPAVHHVDEVLQHVQHVLAAHPAVSLRRRRVQHLPHPPVRPLHPAWSSTKLQRSTAQATSVSSSTSSFLPSNRR